MSKRCPSCDSSHVLRTSFRGPAERRFRLLQSPHRCEECSERFFVISRNGWHVIFGPLVLVITLAIITLLIPMKASQVEPSARPSRGAIVLPNVRASPDLRNNRSWRVLRGLFPPLLLPPAAGEQLHQRIEERPHRRGVLSELVAQHDRRVDADRILARVNRSLGRQQQPRKGIIRQGTESASRYDPW